MTPPPPRRSPASPASNPAVAGGSAKPSLRALAAFWLALAGASVAAATAALVARDAAGEVRRRVGTEFAERAAHLADRLDRGMFERWRDVRIAAALDGARGGGAAADAAPARREVVERLKAASPDYAWIGFTDARGRVVAATGGLLVGQDVSARPWFEAGSRGPYAGDVHEAVLLARHLGGDRPDPPRFVDVAAPVRAADGAVAGVLGAHLYWDWARDAVAAPRAGADERGGSGRGKQAHAGQPDVLVLARDGTVLLGPPGLEGRPLPDAPALPAPGEGRHHTGRTPDGRPYVAAMRATRGHRDYPGLGWVVLVRQDAAQALAPVAGLWRRALLWGGVVALLVAAPAWAGAGLLARSQRRLLAAAAALGRGEPVRPVRALSREVAAVGAALAAASGALRARDRTLAESEAEFRAAFEQTAVGKVQIDAHDGRLLRVNRAFAEPLGYRPDELVGRRVHDLAHPDDREAGREGFARLLAGEVAVLVREKRDLHRDGTPLWRRVSATLVRDGAGRPVRVVSDVEDIAARREAEARRAEDEARLRLAVQCARIGVWELDLRGGRWRLDARAVEITGLDMPADAWVASDAPAVRAWFAALHPDDRAARVAAHARLRRGETDSYAVEYRIPIPCRRPAGRDGDAASGWTGGGGPSPAVGGAPAAADARAGVPGAAVPREGGRWRWIEQQALVVARDARTGAPLRMVGMVQDVTAHRDAQAELERLVEERTAALRQSEAQLAQAQKMQALGQLAGGIAHDFNNVLQAVSGGATLIERRAGDPAAVCRLARALLDAAGRGAAVTRRLLAFARRDELRAEPLPPAAVLEGLREFLAHTLGAGVEVRVEAAPGLPPLLADKGQLEAVLVNLATNARDAMPGGGAVTLAAGAAEVAGTPGARGGAHPAGLRPGRYVRLAVTDTGAGMDAQTLARAAEPFFTTKPRGKGTGLGLSMARGFAEQSGGALRIESRPGRGTTVALWLPAAEAAPAAPERRPAPAAGSPAGRVLLADDDALVRETLTAQLEDAGYAVRAAGDAEEALELLDGTGAVDAVVCALGMPGMDGLALIRAARRRRPGLPAVLLTGYAGDGAGLAAEAASGGGIALLRKPVGAAELAERLAALLAARAGAEV